MDVRTNINKIEILLTVKLRASNVSRLVFNDDTFPTENGGRKWEGGKAYIRMTSFLYEGFYCARWPLQPGFHFSSSSDGGGM